MVEPGSDGARPAIRYVVLSDLHFGARNSVLTSVVDSGTEASGYSAEPRTPSPVLTGLIDGLRHLTAGQERRPTLIMAGDILDLALSPDEVAATVFSGFAALAFGPDHTGIPLFDPVAYYLPGNHDHHLWETAREDQYTDYVAGLGVADDLVAPWHTTAMRPDDASPPISSRLLTSLVRRQPGCGHVDVRVAYPNLALTAPDHRRAVVVSHGHFIEPIYTLMTRLKDILYPEQRLADPDDIDSWESENFAWIDFFWSTLGRSGQVGTDVGLVYAGLASKSVLDDLAANLAKGVMVKGKGPTWLRPLETQLVAAVLKREVNRISRSERGNPDVALSAASRSGLVTYLQRPVRTQMVAELGRVPDEVSFVFGHTHKPFVEPVGVDGYPAAVQVLNTGGWVVDTDVAAPHQAGVVVLVGDDLHAVGLEIYRQSPDGSATPVRVLASPGNGDGGGQSPSEAPGGALGTALADIDPTTEPWRSLSVAAADAVAERHRLQAALM
nr:hypothetical protein [Actinomycetota bacterium]